MVLKEIQTGVLRSKQNNTIGLILGIILTIAGIIVIIMTIPTFDFSKIGSYIGIIITIIGTTILLTWKKITLIINKNENSINIEIKKITKKEQKKYAITDAKMIQYTESIYRERNTNTNKTRGIGINTVEGTMKVNKTVNLLLNNGEIYNIINYSGNYNPFQNKTKTEAQQLADFIGIPLQSNSLGDTIKEIGTKIFGQKNQEQNI